MDMAQKSVAVSITLFNNNTLFETNDHIDLILQIKCFYFFQDHYTALPRSIQLPPKDMAHKFVAVSIEQ